MRRLSPFLLALALLGALVFAPAAAAAPPTTTPYPAPTVTASYPAPPVSSGGSTPTVTNTQPTVIPPVDPVPGESSSIWPIIAIGGAVILAGLAALFFGLRFLGRRRS